ncbi:uncharacterized protein K452DRAFT_341636 [Aplosporella prunicola CBS 121167]|uniref:Uncharacterized protein n=1 Tax=Aplosporella prunicola CBS 121167 TaxID=1176127 RepID=A0A6A6AYR3_9PEZI|nr:uncharacterized protein K452DRAFT_341636 [Aplosporella prunicola CBS 121167]KAF2137069.1 hypothetical protein K452DRAFT_341636 [Aplosporella prunicola CBS 121167]
MPSNPHNQNPHTPNPHKRLFPPHPGTNTSTPLVSHAPPHATTTSRRTDMRCSAIYSAFSALLLLLTAHTSATPLANSTARKPPAPTTHAQSTNQRAHRAACSLAATPPVQTPHSPFEGDCARGHPVPVHGIVTPATKHAIEAAHGALRVPEGRELHLRATELDGTDLEAAHLRLLTEEGNETRLNMISGRKFEGKVVEELFVSPLVGFEVAAMACVGAA